MSDFSDTGWHPELYQLASAIDKRVVDLMAPLIHRINLLEIEREAMWDVFRNDPRYMGSDFERKVKERARIILQRRIEENTRDE